MRVLLKLPPSLHESLVLRAKAEGVTTEDLVLCWVSKAVGREEAARKAEKRFEKQMKKAKKKAKKG